MRLTPRQSQIIPLIAQGLTNREIAMQLRISLSTVENDLGQIQGEMQARNRAHVVDIAWRTGILGPALVGAS